MNVSSTFAPVPGRVRSLYVHVPFCRHRCGYCNFTLVAGRDGWIERYLDAIEIEFSWLSNRPTVNTVFLGGGTPSHLSSSQFQRLFEIINRNVDIQAGAEVSVECNPIDLNREKAITFADCGINRISLGVQSFNDQKLKQLERDHSGADVQTAIHHAHRCTDNVSMDLIFASEHESLADWQQDIQIALSLSPVHVSTYELTIEKGTQFWNRHNKGHLAIAPEDLRADMYEMAADLLTADGLVHYEISSFGRPNYRCRHNLAYWSGIDYLAFGPGASRFVDGTRETNHRSTTRYIQRIHQGLSPVFDCQPLSPRAIALDRIVFGLRCLEGFSLSDFHHDYSFDALRLMGPSAKTLKDHELIETANDRCRLTSKGVLLYDGVATEILNQASEPK